MSQITHTISNDEERWDIEHFALLHQLNGDAVSCLSQLPPVTWAEVQLEFSSSTCADPSALAIRFATQKYFKSHGRTLQWQTLERFALHHGLNEDAIHCLMQLPPVVLVAVMHKFDGSKAIDTSSLFIKYATQKQKYLCDPPQDDATQDALHSVDRWDIDEFAHRCNLNGDAVSCLAQLSLPLFEEVASEFTSGEVEDASGCLIKFATQKHFKAHGQKLRWQSLERFAAQHMLDDDAINCLKSLPPVVLVSVINSFQSAGAAKPSLSLIEHAKQKHLDLCGIEFEWRGSDSTAILSAKATKALLPMPKLRMSTGLDTRTLHYTSDFDSMKKSELRKYAHALGIDEEAIEAAEDADDSKAAFIMLINSHGGISETKPLPGPRKAGAYLSPRAPSHPPPAVSTKPMSPMPPMYPPRPQEDRWEIQEFCEQHGLNGDAASCLAQLPLDLLNEVFFEFSCQGCADPSGILIKFATQKYYKQNGCMLRWQTLDRFGAQNQLNQDALHCLKTLPHVVQVAVINKFQRTGAQDPSALFIKYATQKKLHLCGHKPSAVQETPLPKKVPPPRTSAGAPAQACTNPKVVKLLTPKCKARAEPKTTISNTFDVGGSASDVESQAVISQDVEDALNLEEFVTRNGLNEDAVSCLMQLPPELLEVVLAEFQQKPGVTDCSGMFITFATQKHRTLFGEKLQWCKPGMAPEDRWDIDEFAQRHGLNGDAVSCLAQLPYNICEAVMQEFSCDNVADPSGRLIAFATQKYRKHHGGMLKWATLERFAARHNLNDDASSCLNHLPAVVLAAVIGKFDSAGTLDPSARFIKYALQKHRWLCGLELNWRKPSSVAEPPLKRIRQE